MHPLQQLFPIRLKLLDLVGNLAHPCLRALLLAPNIASSGNFLIQLALASFVLTGSATTFANSISLLDQFILLAAGGLDQTILIAHGPVELVSVRFNKSVFFGRELRDLGLGRELHLGVLNALHMVILVDPAVLVLLPVLLATALAPTATAVVATLSFSLLLALSSVGSLASSLRSATTTSATASSLLIIAVGSSCTTALSSTASATPCRSLGPLLVGVVGGSSITTTSSLATATSCALLHFFAHCIECVLFYL